MNPKEGKEGCASSYSIRVPPCCNIAGFLKVVEIVVVVVVVVEGKVVVVFIKLHITAQPGVVILIFLCYRYGSTLWRISVVVDVLVVIAAVIVLVVVIEVV